MEHMFMPLKRYADFSGRSRRMEFWMWVLFQFLLGLVFAILVVAIGGAAMLSQDATGMVAAGGAALIFYGLWGLCSLAFFIPNLAVTVRRLHDTNRSGWWIMLFWGPYLLALALTVMAAASLAGGAGAAEGSAVLGMLGGLLSILSIVGSLVLLVFMFIDGTPGPNDYGSDPKQRDASHVFA
ncbi:DUF805 domain-containing protein [Sphingosinicella terrae]|jgi:uncharacterized membrane protein YhaH (DUF805 family)|uniref:DUF805 domain-containing protein n=1 Tax=Sphingosinicella terrae TaxID=2172047 RepID=UPI000E0D13F9|nr:DUF805 domain-containing protein [Sphingosinicella terrae]